MDSVSRKRSRRRRVGDDARPGDVLTSALRRSFRAGAAVRCFVVRVDCEHGLDEVRAQVDLVLAARHVGVV